MFTGIITDLGTVTDVTPLGNGQDARFTIGTSWNTGDIAMGASVAVNGCCLTLVKRGQGTMTFDASAETLSKTTLGDWKTGRRVNLERAMRVGDELGGHIVSGHVDGVGEAVSATPENASVRWQFRAPRDLAKFIAAKGSITIDGVSLTVNAVDGDTFGVNIIPHTAQVTGFGTLQPGGRVNLEIDMLARYVARLAEFK